MYQLYEKAYTPWTWFKDLKRAADKAGIIFSATAFDKDSVDLLEDVGVPFHKIASFELVDLELIEYAAATGKPLILSTGMSTLEEVIKCLGMKRKGGWQKSWVPKRARCFPVYPGKR